MLIDLTVDAVKKIFVVSRHNRSGSLRIVGVVTSETVAVDIPRVASANADVDTDEHWTPLVVNGTPLVLDAANNSRAVVSTGKMRLRKSASPGNAFGVEYV